jgi:hypothetical protein
VPDPADRTDPVDLLRQVRAADLRRRLDAIYREERALRVLLRSASAREEQERRRYSRKGGRRG